jgi:mono/diheme cytochrome c family protein
MAWLHDAIAKGSPGGQGRMPEWGGQLEEDEIEATIAWFQSLWPEEIYEIWSEGNARYESRNGG